MSFKLSLKERKPSYFMEEKSRYDVMVGDRKVDELVHDMTGYTGYLMDMYGRSIDIGECGISGFRKEVALLNREAREIMKKNDTDPRRIITAGRTNDGDVRRLVFDDQTCLDVRDRQYRAGVELFGEDRLSPVFFEYADSPCDPEIYAEINDFVVAILETEDPEKNAVIIEKSSPYNSNGNGDGDGDRNVVFLSRTTMDEIRAINTHDVMPALMLPGHGGSSERVQIFKQVSTDKGDQPVILLVGEQVESCEEIIRKGHYKYRIETPEAEVCSEIPDNPDNPDIMEY